MTSFSFPDLPVSERRREIVAALREHQVLVVVGETGSGKTTQLPKMALLAAGDKLGKVGCTQPRRLAAVAVARRLAEELGTEGASLVGYHVRFDDRTGPDTRIQLMTDGILLAETQQDPDLRAYHTIILDEAHERSLNIDFLLGYLKLLLKRRKDLRVIISSATMNAAAFSDFFDGTSVIEVQGRTYPVELHYMPPRDDREDLPAHVTRALQWLTEYDASGDVLVFLPGEREIRECADALERIELPRTDILPLFARLSLTDQQLIFHPASDRRRIVLATNVAETSLTIPGIMYVIDSGLARISRYLPGRQIQSLQVEAISQASARQRAGRCGRVAEGVCIRLYSEEDFHAREAYTDPEIQRSALAGVILRMTDLRLPPLGEFPLPDPPSDRLIREGYKTLREIGAIDAAKKLTPIGRSLARLPLDPRLGRMLLEARRENAAAEALVLVAGLSIQDPRERPSDRAEEADRAHAEWRDEESDFLSMLCMWRAMDDFRDGRKLRRNALRKWCSARYLSFTRMVEWYNLEQDLRDFLALALRWRVPHLLPEREQAPADCIHRAILAGAPLQIGVWNREDKIYRSTVGRAFSIFPGSGLFRRKSRAAWVFGTELAETTRLWLRRAAVLNPVWVEQVAPQLCSCHAFAPEWDASAGVVYARERVVCAGLTIVESRRISYARYHPAEARAIMIRDGILSLDMKGDYPFMRHLRATLERVDDVEHKLRRRGLIRCPEAMFRFYDERIPADCCSEKALRMWLENNPHVLDIPYEECVYPGEDEAPAEQYPDEIHVAEDTYPVYYLHDPDAEDDGVTIGVHIDQLDHFPDYLPSWGVPAHLKQRVEILLRSLPKQDRQYLMPFAESADEFCSEHARTESYETLQQALAKFVHHRTGRFCHPSEFDTARMPQELVTKIWVCDDEGRELALGTNVSHLKSALSDYRTRRFRQQAARTLSSSPMTHWDCGELPMRVEVGSESGYPALADGGNCVRVSICTSLGQAEHVHRAGVRRLAWIRCEDFLQGLRKKLPILDVQARMALMSVGAQPKRNAEMSLMAAMDLALDPLPRTPDDFETACLRMREQLYDILSGSIAGVWQLLAYTQDSLSNFQTTMGKESSMHRVAADLERQWAWLTRPHFLCAAPPNKLGDYARFLRGMRERLQRLTHRPVADDLHRLDLFNATVHQVFYDEYPVHVESAAWLNFAYMVGEYRLSLFAPSLALKGRASAKKLEAEWKTITQGGR